MENQQSEKDILSQLFKERDSYQQANLTQRNEFTEIYNAYIGKMSNNKKLPYKSQESDSKLRTEISYVVPSIFSGSPEIEVEGIGEEDKPIAKILERIVNHRLKTIPQAYEKIESWVKQSVTFGTSIMQVVWKFETEEKQEEPVEGQEIQDALTYQVPVKDEPDFIVHNIADCYYNPILPDIECQNSLIFRIVLPVEEVKENPIYDYVNEQGELNREKIASGSTKLSNYDSTTQQGADSINIQKAGEGTVELFERITMDRIQTVCDGKDRLVLRDKPIDEGFISAVKLTHEPNCIPNRFEGWGVGHNTLGIGKLRYRLWNQTLDSVRLTNNPMFLFLKGNGIDPKQLVAKPGGGVAVDDDQGRRITDVIQPVQFPDIKQGAVSVLEKIEDDHKRASGAIDLVQGAASNKTLGQDQMASSYSSQRFDLIQRRFKQALSDVANILIKMELQNLQSVDAPILRIFPQELRQKVYELLINEAKDIKFNVSVKGETNIAKNKDIQIKQLTDMYNLFAPVLPPKNQMEWAKKLLELRGVDDIDKLIPSPEEMMPQNPMMGAVDPQMMQQGMPQQPQVM